MHKYAKQVLCEAVGRVMALPHRNNREFYGGYEGMFRINAGVKERPIPGTSRTCDVLLTGKLRLARVGKKGNPGEWTRPATVAVEVAVTHFKDEAFKEEIKKAGNISVLEIPLSWEQVRREAERLGQQYHVVVKHILLNQGNKDWLFKRGGEAWVCAKCGGFKRRPSFPTCLACRRKSEP